MLLFRKEYPNITDLSVMRVYYPSVASMLYKTDVVYSWQEIVSEYNRFFDNP